MSVGEASIRLHCHDARRQRDHPKQGVIDRLDALLRFDRPDENISRATRQAQRRAHDREATETAWLDAHRETLRQVISDLLDQADRYGLDAEDRQWLDELALDRDDDLSPATLIILGLAVAELRYTPEVLALPPTRPHTVHTVLARAERLRSQFAELGHRAETLSAAGSSA